MVIDDVYIKYTHSYDEDLQMVNGYGDITSYITDEMLEKDDAANIGSIYYNFYNTYDFSNDNSVILSADAISGDEMYMIYTLLNGNHGYDLDYGGKLISLDQIIIENQYYNERLERLILKEFINYCSYMMFDYIVVIAAKPKNNNEVERIVEFPQIKMYDDFNFVNLGGTENQAPVMIKNLNLRD